MSLRSPVVALLAVVVTACTAVYPTEPTATTVVGLQVIFSPRGRVAVGSTSQFGAITLDSDGVYNAATAQASWTSSDAGIARLIAPGAFAAVAPGTAYITARHGSFEATAPIAVVEAQSLQLFPRLNVSPTSPSRVGNTAQTTAVLRLSSSSQQTVTASATWTSADPNVATVDAGRITGRGLGTTLITVTYGDLVDWFWISIQPGS